MDERIETTEEGIYYRDTEWGREYTTISELELEYEQYTKQVEIEDIDLWPPKHTKLAPLPPDPYTTASFSDGRKPVVCIETGQTWLSAKDASEELKMNYDYMIQKINRKECNNQGLTFRYLTKGEIEICRQ